MRTLNIRLLAILLVGALLTAAVGYGVHGYQVRRNAGALLHQAAAAKAAAAAAAEEAKAAEEAASAAVISPDEKVELEKKAERERKVELEKKIEAVDFLQRYVSLVPRDNCEALADLGLLQADVRRYGPALRNLQTALRQFPERTDLRRRLIDAEIAQGMHSAAIPQLKALLDGTPDDPELLELMARCHASKGDYEDAVESLKDAIDAAPTRLESYASLASIYEERLQESMQARATLDQMVSENATEAKAYVIRGTFRIEHFATPQTSAEGADKQDIPLEAPEQKKQSLAAAMEDARSALRLRPDDESVILFAVRCFLANRLPDDARKYAEHGKDLYPNNPAIYALLADVELQSMTGDLEQQRACRTAAIKWLEQGIKVAPKSRQQDLVWNLCNLYLDENTLDEEHSAIVQSRLSELRKAKYPNPPIEYLDARLLTVQKPRKWLEASVKLEKNRATLVPWPELLKQSDYLLGRCYEGLGNPDLQLTAFRRAASVDPLWIPARLGVAVALTSTGNIDEAVREYAEIVKLMDKSKVEVGILLEMTRLMIRSNLQKTDDRDWESVVALLNKIDEVMPNSSQVAILKTEVLLAQDKTENAVSLLQTARNRSPEDLELWLGLAAISARREEWSEARRILDEAKTNNGDKVQLRLARAKLLVNQRAPNARDELRELAKPAPTYTTEETMQLYAGMAQLTFMLEDYDETARLCKAVASEYSSDLLTRLILFDTAIRAKWKFEERLSVMTDVLREMLEISGQSPLWHYGTAVELRIKADQAESEGKTELRSKCLQDAKQHLELARATRRAWSRIPVLLADINVALGDEQSALDNYLDAINIDEQNPATLSRTVTLLHKFRRFEEADKLIRRYGLDRQTGNPFSTTMLRLATELSIDRNQDRALELMTTRFRATNAEEHVWAGKVYAALGKLIEAETSFHKAIEFDETQPDPWVALIQFLGKTQQFEKATTEFALAEKKIDRKEVSLALTQCIEFTGKSFDEMEARLLEILAGNPKDLKILRQVIEFYLARQKLQKAEPRLEQIITGELNATDEARIWARRNLALALTNHPDQASKRRALALLDENLKVNPASIPDRRVKAVVLSKSGERKLQLQAIELLETLVKESRSQETQEAAEERFVLAQLYKAIGDSAKVRSHMHTLLATHGSIRRYVEFYAQFLYSQKEIEEGDKWLHGLENADKSQQQDVYAKLSFSIEALYVREKYDELLSAVDLFVNEPGIDPAESQARIRHTAVLLERYSDRLKRGGQVGAKPSAETDALSQRFIDKSEELFRRNAQENPPEALALAGFCSRHGRLDEALELLERAWRTAQPTEITAVTIHLMTSPAATPQQLARVDKLLRAALEKNGRHILLVQALADLLSWREEYDEAEALYRESLAKGDHPLALNNMALLLALRGKGGNESLQLIERAIELIGLDPSLLDSRATINLALGNPQLALPDLILATEKRRDSPLSYFHQAQVEIRLGQKDSARNSIAKANELGLQVENLHPLERKGYLQLQQELR